MTKINKNPSDSTFLEFAQDPNIFEAIDRPIQGWKSIPNTDGSWVSTWGRIRIKKGDEYYILPFHIRPDGAIEVNIIINGKSTKKLVHRLVAMAHLEGMTENQNIEFIDGDRSNPFLSNLRIIPKKKKLTKNEKRLMKLEGVHKNSLSFTGDHSLLINYDEYFRSGYTFPGEIWAHIPHYLGVYMVSNYGRIWSNRQKRATILKPIKNQNGMLRITTSVYNTTYQHLIHLLVADAFVSNTHGRDSVGFINGIKTDPRACNLEWI